MASTHRTAVVRRLVGLLQAARTKPERADRWTGLRRRVTPEGPVREATGSRAGAQANSSRISLRCAS